MKHKGTYIATLAAVLILAMGSCSTQKNTARTRWWHAFNTRYNIYFNGEQAFIDGNLTKEKGNKDNYTELIPLYTIGNKESRSLGKADYALAVEKCEKAISRHSIKAKPEWDKSRRKTAKDREWLNRKEYNPFLWRAWLLMGKAQFQMGELEEAAATFSYMSHLYQTQPRMNGLAKAWLAKCYTELGWRYDAEDVIRNMSRDSVDFRTVKDWDYTYANYYIHEGDYEKAIPYLHKVIKHERRRVQRAREWFLMGQIQNLLGNKQEAYKAFGKTISCNPPYELEFNARIAQTEVMGSSDGRQMISKLKRMAASDNNQEYLDQVYYAIGNIHLIQRDTTQAIAAYEKGNTLSVRNGIEKGVLLLKLGNIYWQKEQFADAQRCYGEAIGLLDKDRKDYEHLALRSKVLDELVPYTDAIHLQDSLLALAAMPEAELNKVIDRMISDLKKKEKEERDRLLENETEQQQSQQQAGMTETRQVVTTPTQQSGQWYFYNPTAVSQGKITFQRQWGKRENADNWQRRNQTLVNLGEPDNPEISENQNEQENIEEPVLSETIDSTTIEMANDPHQREYYLAQIPFTDEQKAACHDILKESLFKAGIILKDKLDNLTLSEKYLRRLTDNYQDFAQIDEAWYHLYLLYMRQGRAELADYCLSMMKAKHPESEWTLMLSDPNYAENARWGEHMEDSLYAATYEAFKANRTDVVSANARLSDQRFPQGANRAKFLLIDGLSQLNAGDGDACMIKLREVVEKYPESEVTPLASMIIKGVQDGRRLQGGKFDIGDVWTKRDITLSKDSTIADTLSTERNQQYLFILVYHPDSVNENQLLFEMAKHNFTSYLVRNFEINIDEDEGLHRMLISGFLSYDEARQYARELYQNEPLTAHLKDCRNLVISETNLKLIGKQFSYDEYQQFYEQELLPLSISKEKLLLNPESIDQPDIEDMVEPVQKVKEEEETEAPQQNQRKKAVQDFDFGDDFW